MLESRFAEHRRFDFANKAPRAGPGAPAFAPLAPPGGDLVTVTLPSPTRLALALALVVIVFAAAFAAGRSRRPPAPRVGPAGPVPLQSGGAAPASATVTAPPAEPPLPALKLLKPRVPTARAARVRPVV
jgi:hypothetical protein